MSTLFTTDVIRSDHNFLEFMNAERDLEQIRNFQHPEHYFTGWEITRVGISAPIGVIGYLFLMGIGFLLYAVRARDLAKRCAIIATHLLTDFFSLIYLCRYGENYLRPFANAPAISRSDLYLHPPVSWTDTVFDGHDTEADFCNARGVCYGMAHWFAFLYFYSLKTGKDPEELIYGCAEIFKDGATAQAALLQTVRASSHQHHLLSYKEECCVSTTLSEINQDIASFSSNFNALNPAIYGISFCHHRVAYIKIREDLGFLIDPNGGIIKMASSDQAETLLSHLNLYNNFLALWSCSNDDGFYVFNLAFS
jgi:hypothetical protein